MDHLHPDIARLARRAAAIEATLGDAVTPRQAEALNTCYDELVAAAWYWDWQARDRFAVFADIALRTSLARARAALLCGN